MGHGIMAKIDVLADDSPSQSSFLWRTRWHHISKKCSKHHWSIRSCPYMQIWFPTHHPPMQVRWNSALSLPGFLFEDRCVVNLKKSLQSLVRGCQILHPNSRLPKIPCRDRTIKSSQN